MCHSGHSGVPLIYLLFECDRGRSQSTITQHHTTNARCDLVSWCFSTNSRTLWLQKLPQLRGRWWGSPLEAFELDSLGPAKPCELRTVHLVRTTRPRKTHEKWVMDVNVGILMNICHFDPFWPMNPMMRQHVYLDGCVSAAFLKRIFCQLQGCRVRVPLAKQCWVSQRYGWIHLWSIPLKRLALTRRALKGCQILVQTTQVPVVMASTGQVETNMECISWAKQKQQDLPRGSWHQDRSSPSVQTGKTLVYYVYYRRKTHISRLSTINTNRSTEGVVP